MTARHPGCHGVLIEPEEIGLGLGWLEQPPPLHAVVDVVDRVGRSPDARLVWFMEKTLAPGYGRVRAEMWREPGGRLWFGNRFADQDDDGGGRRTNLACALDVSRGTITIAPTQGGMQSLFEVLASVVLPALTQAHGRLILHASACSLDGRATLITAPGGSGKSSLLTGLVAAGWEALSEDQCVVDLSGAFPRVWPGAGWVRLDTGTTPPPPIRRVRYSALDKTAWDLGPWTRRAPAEITRIVVLEPPGEPLWEPIDPAVLIGLLARQSAWHYGLKEFVRGSFTQLVDLALAVPARRLRLRRSPGWLGEAVTILGASERASLPGIA